MDEFIKIPSNMASILRQSLICRECELVRDISVLSRLNSDYARRFVSERTVILRNVRKLLDLV